MEGCLVRSGWGRDQTSERSTADVAARVVPVAVLCFVDTEAAQVIATMDHMTGLNSLSVHPLEPNLVAGLEKLSLPYLQFLDLPALCCH